MSQNTEQNVRTREEQVEALAYQVFTGIMGATKKRHEFAVAHIQEAEARGAAEQRRKDAEVSEPVAWRYEVKRMGYWVSREVGYGPRVWEWYCSEEKPDSTDPDYRNVFPLYDRPANVAALEAALRTIADRADREGATIDDDECAAIARAALTREGGV